MDFFRQMAGCWGNLFTSFGRVGSIFFRQMLSSKSSRPIGFYLTLVLRILFEVGSSSFDKVVIHFFKIKIKFPPQSTPQVYEQSMFLFFFKADNWRSLPSPETSFRRWRRGGIEPAISSTIYTPDFVNVSFAALIPQRQAPLIDRKAYRMWTQLFFGGATIFRAHCSCGNCRIIWRVCA